MCRGPCGPNRLQESPDPEKPWTVRLLSILLSLGNLRAPGARRPHLHIHQKAELQAGSLLSVRRLPGLFHSWISTALLWCLFAEQTAF